MVRRPPAGRVRADGDRRKPRLAELAADSLRTLFKAQGVTEADEGIQSVMGAFMELPVHPDVVEGIRRLSDTGIRLVTLSNGSTSVAKGLFEAQRDLRPL